MKQIQSNLKITSQIAFCPYALSLDLYKGCPHRCAYCFAQTEHGEQLNVSTKNNISLFSFDKVIKYIVKDPKLKVGYIYDLINKKQPLHIGGMADPFPYRLENKLGHSLSFIKQVREYPCIWSTKNPPASYVGALAEGNHILQFSAIGDTKNDKRVSAIEPGLPDFETRFKKLKHVKPGVKKIVLRLQPFIPFLWTYETLQYFLDTITKTVDAVSIEFLKKPVGENWRQFSKVMGFDIAAFFNNSPVIDMGSDKAFDTIYRYKMLKLLKKMIHERGMEFYSAENYFRHLSDSPFCCGISGKDGEIFQSKLNYCLNVMLFKAKKEGCFCWADIETAMPPLLKKGKWMLRFDKRLAKLTIYTILKYRYSEKNKLSPAKIFANLEPKYINGVLHYIYKEKKFNYGFNMYLEQYDKDYGNSILKDAKVI